MTITTSDDIASNAVSNPIVPDPKAVLITPAYSAIAQVFSQTLTASAAMLAFFFLFQGTLLANFPTLYEKFSNATFPSLGDLPLGRAALVALCLLALIFTGWSFLIVRIFGVYVDSFVASGSALEAGNGAMTGLFGALAAAFERRASHRWLTLATTAFFVLLVLLWFGLMAIAIFGRPTNGGFL